MCKLLNFSKPKIFLTVYFVHMMNEEEAGGFILGRYYTLVAEQM